MTNSKRLILIGSPKRLHARKHKRPFTTVYKIHQSVQDDLVTDQV